MIAQLDLRYIKARPTKALVRLISYVFFEGRPLTTRGRAINPVLFSLFSLEKHLPAIKSVVKPIFIVGMGRSGTTVLGRILSLHRDVGFLNEPKALWHGIYPNEDVIGSYSAGGAKYRLMSDDVTEETRRTAHRLLGFYLLFTGAKRLVEKYPELIFRVPFVKGIYPDARFLFLVRDGWDVCRSVMEWEGRFGKRKDVERHNWWGCNDRKWNLLVEQIAAFHPDFAGIMEPVRGFRRTVDRAAVEWILTAREGTRLLTEYPDICCRIRYENLLSRPRTTLADILGFCELEYDEQAMDYADDLLSGKRPRKPCDLHPALRPLFEQAMSEMGYEYHIG